MALIYSATTSLDGFMAGPGGDMSWLTEHLGGEDEVAERVLARTGALLVGRVTFDGDDPNAGTEAEGAFGGEYDGPTVVLTHRPPADPVAGVEFVTDLTAAVARARELAGDRDVNVLGADVAMQCLEAGLLDEVLVLVAPVLLGEGTRMFPRRPGGRVRLEPLPGETATGTASCPERPVRCRFLATSQQPRRNGAAPPQFAVRPWTA